MKLPFYIVLMIRFKWMKIYIKKKILIDSLFCSNHFFRTTLQKLCFTVWGFYIPQCETENLRLNLKEYIKGKRRIIYRICMFEC